MSARIHLIMGSSADGNCGVDCAFLSMGTSSINSGFQSGVVTVMTRHATGDIVNAAVGFRASRCNDVAGVAGLSRVGGRTGTLFGTDVGSVTSVPVVRRVGGTVNFSIVGVNGRTGASRIIRNCLRRLGLLFTYRKDRCTINRRRRRRSTAGSDCTGSACVGTDLRGGNGCAVSYRIIDIVPGRAIGGIVNKLVNTFARKLGNGGARSNGSRSNSVGSLSSRFGGRVSGTISRSIRASRCLDIAYFRSN